MKKIIIGVFFVVGVAAGTLIYLPNRDTINPYVRACDYTVPESEIPKFDEATINFKHEFDVVRRFECFENNRNKVVVKTNSN